MRTLILLLITIIMFASAAVAQSKKDKIEIGVQTTSLTVFHPDAPFRDSLAEILGGGLIIKQSTCCVGRGSGM